METGFRDDRGRFVYGNPGGPGRPRFSIVSIIKAKLAEVPEGDTRSRAERLVEEYLTDAEVSKDGVAIRDLMDRFDGRPKQTVEVQDDRQSAWDALTREMFVEPESETAGDSRPLQEGAPKGTNT